MRPSATFICDAVQSAPSPLFLARALYASLGPRKRQGRGREKDPKGERRGGKGVGGAWLCGWLVGCWCCVQYTVEYYNAILVCMRMRLCGCGVVRN